MEGQPVPPREKVPTRGQKPRRGLESSELTFGLTEDFEIFQGRTGLVIFVDTNNQPSRLPGQSVQVGVAARNNRRVQLCMVAVDDVPTAAKLYRQAGDAFLTAEQDYANAARCYRLFLARGGDNALSPEPSDSWLLTSLKNAAFKEKVHATLPNG